MNSLTGKPFSSVLQPSSFVAQSSRHPLCAALVRLPTRKITRGGRFSVKVKAYDSSKADETSHSNGDTRPPKWRSEPKNRRDILLEYVKNVQPEFMELFVKKHRSRNAQYRLELQQSLEQVALPEEQDKKDKLDYAPGTQKKVSGEVMQWNEVFGPEAIDAKKYIELLEAEIEELNSQLDRKSTTGQNELLEFLRTLEPQNLKDLTSSAGEDVIVAMDTFIKRLLAVSDPSKMKTSATKTSATELAKLLYWLMVVGYSIRNIEVRFDMERVLGAPPKLAELPPGENA